MPMLPPRRRRLPPLRQGTAAHFTSMILDAQARSFSNPRADHAAVHLRNYLTAMTIDSWNLSREVFCHGLCYHGAIDGKETLLSHLLGMLSSNVRHVFGQFCADVEPYRRACNRDAFLARLDPARQGGHSARGSDANLLQPSQPDLVQRCRPDRMHVDGMQMRARWDGRCCGHAGGLALLLRCRTGLRATADCSTC